MEGVSEDFLKKKSFSHLIICLLVILITSYLILFLIVLAKLILEKIIFLFYTKWKVKVGPYLHTEKLSKKSVYTVKLPGQTEMFTAAVCSLFIQISLFQWPFLWYLCVMFVKANFEARDLSINSHLLLPVLFLMKGSDWQIKCNCFKKQPWYMLPYN